MSLADTYNESQRQQVLLDRLEVTVRNRMASEINRYIRAAASAYDSGDMLLLAFLESEHQRRIMAILEANIRKTIPTFGKEVMRQIEAAVKQNTQTLWQRMIDSWLLTEGLAKATSIAKTSVGDVQQAITEALKDSISTSVVANAIRKVARLTPNRAEMIARTETHNAATFASTQTARSMERDLNLYLVKKWLPVLDARTRDRHAAMASHPAIPLDEKFNVGGEMMDRPGDPTASAGNVIRCRCTISYRRKQIEIE